MEENLKKKSPFLKFIGWVLIICGIVSLPSFFKNLSNAHDGYELIGMLIGEGLIFLVTLINNPVQEGELTFQKIYEFTEMWHKDGIFITCGIY